jgi:hypothetical protein
MLALHFVMEFLFGALEAFATLLLSFALFRIPFRTFFYHLIGFSFVISGVCLLLYNFLNVPFMAGEILLFFIIGLFYWITLKVKIWQSILVTVVGNIGALLFQGVAYLPLWYLGYLEESTLTNTEQGLLSLMTLQFFYAVVAFHAAIVMYRYRIGFVFLRPSKISFHSKSPEHIQYIIMILLSLFSCIYMTHLMIYGETAYNIYKGIFLIVLNLLSIGIVYLMNRENLINEYENISKNIRL